MSDRLIYDFSQQVPKTTLTDLGATIGGIYQEQEAARVHRNNQITYDQRLQTYMQDPSEENLVALYGASEPLGLTDQTRSTVAEVQKIRSDREAAALRAQQENAYQVALRTYMANKSRDNLMALYEAAEPLGRFEDIVKATDNLSAREQEEDAAQGMSILAPLRAGNTEGAIVALDKLIEAYTNDGNTVAVNGYNAVKDMIEKGDIEGADTMLSIILGSTEAGRNAMGNLYDLSEEQRAEESQTADQLITAIKTEITDEKRRGELLELAPFMDHPKLAETMINLLSIVKDSEGGAAFTLEDLLAREEALRKEYDAYVKPYEIVVDQFDVIYRLTNGWSDPTGMTDQAMVVLYNKLLDPTSVVRQSEADMTAESQAIFGATVAKIQGWFDSGQKFSDDARAALMDAAVVINDLAQKEIDKQRDRIQHTVDVLEPINAKFGIPGSSADRIFQYSHSVEESRRSRQELIDQVAAKFTDPGTARLMMEYMTEDEIRAQFPQAVGRVQPTTTATGNRLNDLRAFIRTNNPNSTANIDSMTEEQLKSSFPNGYKAFNEQNPGRDLSNSEEH